MARLITAVMAFFLLASAYPVGYYVDFLNGDDEQAGTEAEPWKSITKVNTFNGYEAGDTVYFRRGQTWYETLSHDSGGEVINHAAYGTGHSPIIAGSTIYGGTDGQLEVGTDSCYGFGHVDTNLILTNTLTNVGDHGVWLLHPDSTVITCTRVSTIADCSNTLDTWYFDGGSTLYVNLAGAEVPVNELVIHVLERALCVEVWTGQTFTDLQFAFGLNGNYNLGCSNFTFTDCRFIFNAHSGIETGCNGSQGPGQFLRCESAWNGRYGFWHHYTSVAGDTYLDYCLIHSNGWDGIYEACYINVESHADWVRNSAIFSNGAWGVNIWNASDNSMHLKAYNNLIIANGVGDASARDHAGVNIYDGSNAYGPVYTFSGKWTLAASDITSDPMLTGADVVTSATALPSWTAEDLGDPVLSFALTSQFQLANFDNYRVRLYATHITESATRIRLKLSAPAGGGVAFNAVRFGLAGTADDFNGAPTACTFAGSATVSIPAGESVYTDWFDFTLDEALDYTTSFYCAATTNWLAQKSSTNGYYRANLGSDDSATETVDYGTQAGIVNWVAAIEKVSATPGVIYYTSGVTATPYQVLDEDVPLSLAASKDAVTEAGLYYYSAGTIYTYGEPADAEWESADSWSAITSIVPLEGSPLIDAGSGFADLSVDYLWAPLVNSPDIGAYEFQYELPSDDTIEHWLHDHGDAFRGPTIRTNNAAIWRKNQWQNIFR